MQQDTNPLLLDGVVEHVMRFLPQNQRLGAAALVSTGWHAAALAVSAEEGVLVAPCTPAAEAWLLHHGAQMQALVVRGGKICTEGPASCCPSSMHHLTRLEVDTVTCKPALLRAIGDSMKALRYLRLINLCWGPLISTACRQELATAAGTLWAGCQQLTYLQSERCDLDNECVQSLCSNLRSLKTLDLSHNSITDAHSLGSLPLGLTALHLGGNASSLDATPLLAGSSRNNSTSMSNTDGRSSQSRAAAHPASTTSSSSAVSGDLQELQALDIAGLTLSQPIVLAALTALTWLCCDGVRMRDLRDLMGPLPRLVRLKQLNMLGCAPPESKVHLTTLRSALQPLTQLTALDCSCISFLQEEENGAEAAPAADPVRLLQQRHLFDGLHLPNLQLLHADGLDLLNSADEGVGHAAFQHLAAACPRLAWLRTVQPGAELSMEPDLRPLTQLAHSLTRLDLALRSALSDSDCQVLTQLPQLLHLDVTGAGGHLSDKGLYALTSLTHLTHLEVHNIGSGGPSAISEQVLPKLQSRGGEFGHTLWLTAKIGKTGHVKATVSQQLKEICSKSPQLVKELQEDLKSQLKAARKDAKDARKEAAAERKKASSAQKQARKAQQQAAAAQDEVAALRQQLEALQGQLQQSQGSG